MKDFRDIEKIIPQGDTDAPVSSLEIKRELW